MGPFYMTVVAAILQMLGFIHLIRGTFFMNRNLGGLELFDFLPTIGVPLSGSQSWLLHVSFLRNKTVLTSPIISF